MDWVQQGFWCTYRWRLVGWFALSPSSITAKVISGAVMVIENERAYFYPSKCSFTSHIVWESQWWMWKLNIKNDKWAYLYLPSLVLLRFENAGINDKISEKVYTFMIDITRN